MSLFVVEVVKIVFRLLSLNFTFFHLIILFLFVEDYVWSCCMLIFFIGYAWLMLFLVQLEAFYFLVSSWCPWCMPKMSFHEYFSYCLLLLHSSCLCLASYHITLWYTSMHAINACSINLYIFYVITCILYYTLWHHYRSNVYVVVTQLNCINAFAFPF